MMATTMIATTTTTGTSVRLSAEFHVDTANVYYVVYCSGFAFEFGDFAPAARVYKTLSNRIEAGATIDILLKNLVTAARTMGYSVKEVA